MHRIEKKILISFDYRFSNIRFYGDMEIMFRSTLKKQK